MNFIDQKRRRDEIIARELEINAQLAESKRAFFVDKIESPISVRATLEAELAALAVEKHSLTKLFNDTKTALRVYRGTLAHALLIKLVTEKGLGDLVIEADKMAADAAGVLA